MSYNQQQYGGQYDYQYAPHQSQNLYQPRVPQGQQPKYQYEQYEQPRYQQRPPPQQYNSQVSFGQGLPERRFQQPQTQNQFRNLEPINLNIPQEYRGGQMGAQTTRNQEVEKLQEELEMLEYQKQRREQKRGVPVPVVEDYKSAGFSSDEDIQDVDEGSQKRKTPSYQQDVEPRLNYYSQPNLKQQPQHFKSAESAKDGNDKLYEQLYHKVMTSQNPKNRIERPNSNNFEIYKNGWNEMQDKQDKEYQKKLRQANIQSQQRLENAQKLREYNLQQKAIKFKQEQASKEMEECTFSPRIKTSNSALRYDQKLGPRSGMNFYRSQEQFLAKKEMTIEQKRREQISQIEQLKQNEFMSVGSKKLLQQKSTMSLTKSQSQNSFLQRNYYNPKEKRASRASAGKLDITGEKRDLSSSNTYARDISGSKVSFLNSTTSQTGNKLRDESGKVLFQPQINYRSKLMSPRDKETTFYMLHQAAINQQRKQQIKIYEENVQAKNKTNQAVQKVNSQSDQVLIKQFYDEFCIVIQNQVAQSNQIYLVDVLDQLFFISEEQLMRQSLKLNALMKQQKRNLYIDTDAGQFRGESEDITKNLFKICCAIMNLRPKQRGQNPLDDAILKHYLEAIQHENRQNRETLVIDQLQILKGLVNRKAFSLTDKQVFQINRKFINFSLNRKDHIFKNRKKGNLDRVEKSTTPFFSPKINPRSRDMDQGALTDRSVPRTDIMYGYAEKYTQHKNELKEVYRDNSHDQFKYQPQLNPKSLRLARDSSFSDRTMKQYMTKHKRVDRDPVQIEFDKNKDECTFKPTVAPDVPKKPKVNLPMSHNGYQIPAPQETPQVEKQVKPEAPPKPLPPPLSSRRPMNSYLPVVEEPICVLKIELDGEHIEEIKVFENDDPNEIVQKFGNDFNLSQNARQRLLDQIQEHIQIDDYC